MYPTDLDNLFDPVSTTPLNNTPKGHSDWHTDPNNAIEALEAKVGKDGSAVITSHDYKLAHLSNVDNTSDATKNSATVTLTNKTLTSPVINTPTFSEGAVGGADLSTSAITLGYAEITSDFTTTTTPTDVDVTNLAVTVTVPAGGRRVKITAYTAGMFTTSASASIINLKIKEGSTILNLGSYTQNGADETQQVTAQAVLSSAVATAGSHTYKVAIAQSAAGTLTVQAAATYASHILVELI